MRYLILLLTLVLARCGDAGDQAAKDPATGDSATVAKAFPEQIIPEGEAGNPFREAARSMPIFRYSERYAFGDLNGDGNRDAAVVQVNTEVGSGVFYHLKALLNQHGRPVEVASTKLGDGIKVDSLWVESGQMQLKMRVPAPRDPECCPTRNVTRTYVLQDGELVAKAR